MFIGHFAVGLAATSIAPEVSLGTLFLAAQLADLVWPTLVLAGIESFSIRPGITAVTPLDFIRYPYSHSLVGMALWGMGLSLLYFVARRRGVDAAILFAVVLSHWLLDFVSHRPDLPLTLTGAEASGSGCGIRALRRGGLDRAGDLATRRLGILDRPSSHRLEELKDALAWPPW
jgi:hypothetical protein